ncbi:hypothetical protein [Haliscomenobacter sp.]|uniref:hypothetical protein n=1 Tax=Haliscomenobacter sp. TaxID=2717303 RepID=UPI00336507A9
MYKQIELINSVKSFDLSDGLCYLNSEGWIISSNTYLEKLDAFARINVLNKLLFWQSHYGYFQVYDLSSKKNIYASKNKVNEVSIGIFPEILPESKIIVNIKEETNKAVGVLNLYSGDIEVVNLSASRFYIFLAEYEMLICVSEVISAYHYPDLRDLWTYAPKGFYYNMLKHTLVEEVRFILGIRNSFLWVSLSSGNIVGLDVLSGVYCKNIGHNEVSKDIFPYLKEGDSVPHGDKMQLDVTSGELITLRNKYYIYANLNDLEPWLDYIDVSDSMGKHQLESSYRNNVFPIDENYIYFCDDRRGKIGVFDRHKREVVWSYELEMERSGIAQILEMKYANDRWYILDRNDTLHVFERIKINETNQQTKP